MRGEGGLREDGGWSTGACVLTSVYPHPGRVLTDVAKRTLRVDLLKHRTPAAYAESFIYAREKEPIYYIDGLQHNVYTYRHPRNTSNFRQAESKHD